MNVQSTFDRYAAIVAAQGARLEAGVDTLLALRGVDPSGKHHDSSENTGPYDDTLVLLHQDAQGHGTATEMLGSTHAGNKKPLPGFDRPVAQIRPGSYVAVPHHNFNGQPSWHLLTQSGNDALPAWRDLNEDGVISDDEKASAQKEGCTASAILLHAGMPAGPTNSVGCQTLPPDTMRSFIAQEGQSHRFNYILVDANAKHLAD